jgi:hypothetical protein
MVALTPNLWTLQLRSRTACEDTSLGALPASIARPGQAPRRMTRTLLSKKQHAEVTIEGSRFTSHLTLAIQGIWKRLHPTRGGHASHVQAAV